MGKAVGRQLKGRSSKMKRVSDAVAAPRVFSKSTLSPSRLHFMHRPARRSILIRHSAPRLPSTTWSRFDSGWSGGPLPGLLTASNSNKH